MVGDSGIDIATARAASIDSIGVAWGFRYADELCEAGANHVVESVDKLRLLLAD
jgi:phosphoglycolate phosphatase